eukprot:15361850-Ditylum_brightwellii.AAC.1
MMKTPSAIKNLLDGGRLLLAKNLHPLVGTLGDGCLASCCTMRQMISLSWCNGAFSCWAADDSPAHVVLGTWHT